MIRLAWASVAVLALTTPQDLLGQGDEGMINYPGREEGNWTWRLPADFFARSAGRLAGRLRRLGEPYGRTLGG
jgi:4-alpha-glucanotransferase